jgi:hypothetical protein
MGSSTRQASGRSGQDRFELLRREGRSSLVKCENPPGLDGNLKIEAECTVRNGKVTAAQGDLSGTGVLFVFDDPARQQELGYGYEARFQWPSARPARETHLVLFHTSGKK